MRSYRPRVYDDILSFRLSSKGAVLVEGPKWCGKTTTAKQAAKSAVYLQDPATRERNLLLAQTDPAAILSGEVPRLIDEWQDAPVLWDAVRHEVDMRDEFGQFVLTGSVVLPDMQEVRHSGTGRISRMRMRTMSSMESGDSDGAVSLSSLFAGEEIPIADCESDLEKAAFLVCRGGWPTALRGSQRVALQQARDYVDAVAETDISRVDGVARSPHSARLLMRSFSRMVSSQGSSESMRADLLQAGVNMGEKTFGEYLGALRRLFVVEDLAAWNPNLRSKTAIRTSPTRHFTDPSIAAASLGADPSGLLDDMESFGLLFESLCVRDLRVYADALDGELFHYRDKSGLECDAVLRLRDGRYALVEVKLGGKAACDQAAANLKKLAGRIDVDKMRAPSFLMVLTGTGTYSYRRDDGVLCVPYCVLGV